MTIDEEVNYELNDGAVADLTMEELDRVNRTCVKTRKKGLLRFYLRNWRMRKNGIVTVVLVMVVGLFVGLRVSHAQQQKKSPVQGSPLIWKIDSILDWYVSHITQYYNLNEAQENYTRKLLTVRVKKFLKDYETDVRSLAAEMLDYQFKRELPPPEIAQDWANRGLPLYQAIREEIINGNMTWRQILTEEQKAKHDKDLELMKKQFGSFEKRLNRWKNGEVRPSDFGLTRISERPVIRKSEDAWIHYVQRFIRIYKLDTSQSEVAYSIYREMQKRAADYRNEHKDEFASLDKKLKERYAAKPKAEPEQIRAKQKAIQELNKRRLALEKPISKDMFNELKAKLEKIPTAEQRRDREEIVAKLRERYKKAQAATQPATGTQPASKQQTTQTAK